MAERGGPAARAVLQQCLQARLQVKPAEEEAEAQFVQIERGMVIYICFFKGATDNLLPKMVLLTSCSLFRFLFLLSLGFYFTLFSHYTYWRAWRHPSPSLPPRSPPPASTLLNLRLCESDSGKMVSVSELPGDLLIVPQATLGGKAKGRALQYHDNIGKEDGLRLYAAFVSLCEERLAAASVKHGTYGNRQVLKLDTNGPYTHLVDF